MFNTTHTLVGIALARTGMDRWAPYATWTAVIASNLPDFDIVTQFAGTASYIDHHRGITHAPAAIPFLALFLAFVMHRLAAIRGQPAAPLRNHFAVAIIAMATHPLLDWTNTYGVRPFLPVDATWYYGDTLFIIDLYLDSILLIGVVVSRGRRIAAWVTLLVAIAYLGARLESRELARHYLANLNRNVSGFVASGVQPDMLNPFVWSGFVETQTEFSRIWINLRTGETERVSALPKTPGSPVVAAAEATYTGQVFRRFARFPVTHVEETPSGYRVLLIDFRFYRQSDTAAMGLAAEFLLDRSLKVQRESMSFTASLPKAINFE